MPSPRPNSTDVRLDFRFQEAQRRLLVQVRRNGGVYTQLKAPQCLEIGGQRSGKTVGKLMFGVIHYCLRFAKCDILVLRRTFPELKNGAMQDFRTFVPKELYDMNESEHVATFANGSRVVFASCANNVERDIEKYLGQAYPYILVDECSQFSNDVWERLYARNLVNASCEADEYGNLPSPAIVGCTNPIGAFWGYYHTVFIEGKPWEAQEGQRRAKDGSWWVPPYSDESDCVYNPANYAYNHTTIFDNAEYQKRDPGAIARLRALPPAKRKKFLEGYMGSVEGQYFDCWSEEHHVIDLRDDPEAVIWQDWQPVWVGQDFGVGHWNAAYFFTKALVRKSSLSSDYVLKTVCFAEMAPESTGHTNVELADMLMMKARYPRLPEDHSQFARISGKTCRVSTIYFSHEKFARQMEAHSPADEYSRLLRERGLPSVSRASTNRIGRASLMYNMLKNHQLVILKTCSSIIQAIPALMRDPDNLDDVLKTDSKADDRYDGFAYGLYGYFNPKAVPSLEKAKEYAEKLDPFNRHFYMQKKKFETAKNSEEFVQKNVPYWMTKR